MTVSVATKRLGKSPGLTAGTVRRRAEAMLAALDASESELSVLLCDDGTIAALNSAWRGKPRPTDVLSFPMGEAAAPSGPRLLGDVVISVPTAARQAAERGEPLRVEVCRLLAHGILHLLGHVHDTKAALRTMERETDRLVELAEPVSRPRRSGA